MNVLALQDAAPTFFDLAPGDGSMDMVGAWLICFLTLAVYSFLYRDNSFYKVAEHVFVGVGTAYFALEFYEQGILEPIVEHIGQALEKLDAGGAVELGAFQADPAWAIFWRGLAAVLGLFLLIRIFAPNSWMPRWPLAIMVGVYAALKMTGETQSKLVLQLKGAMKPLTSDTALAWSDNWSAIEETKVYYTVANTILLIGFLCALAHFIFTYRRTRVLAGASRVGIVVLMITFGSMFGFTVLGRIALLIERVETLGNYADDRHALFGAALLSPPYLLGAVITIVLLLGALQRRDNPPTDRTAT